MAPYTVVDGTHLQMALNKPHQSLATLAFGGLCGYGLSRPLTPPATSVSSSLWWGSNSATSLYYAGGTTPVVGMMNQTSGYINVSASIASAARSGNVVTVTTTGNLPENINGLTATVAGVADSSYNGSFIVTTTGLNSFTFAQIGANSSSSGGTVAVLSGGFALYPMAEVLSVFDPATKTVDGQMTLAPNSVPLEQRRHGGGYPSLLSGVRHRGYGVYWPVCAPSQRRDPCRNAVQGQQRPWAHRLVHPERIANHCNYPAAARMAIPPRPMRPPASGSAL